MTVWIGVAVVVFIFAVACFGDLPDKKYECIACKREFKDSEKTTIDTYNPGDEAVIADACPFCKSDMIFEKEASE
jgi:transposase-like protein